MNSQKITDKMNIPEQILKSIKEATEKLGHVNVLIAGRSGVGKSTLINAVFQGNLAATGQGRPVTKDAKKYTKEGIPISIIDSRGLEMSHYKETVRQLKDFIKLCAGETDPKCHIHVAWLCIGEDSRRVEDGESAVCEMLSDCGIPVIGVITKARNDQGFQTEVHKLLHQAKNIVRVRAIGEEDEEGNVHKPKGLKELIDCTMEVVPEGQRNAFAAAQKVSIDQKKKRSHKMVVGFSVTAGGIGAAPIPFADAILLVPLQITMLATISAVFGLDLSKAFLTTLIGSAVTAVGATYVGRSIVAGLLKLIPGIGSVVGGAISATTASIITMTFGEIYIGALAKLFLKNPDELPSAEEIADAFSSDLRMRSSKN